jgi:large subunit ribosomal protein L21
MYAIIKAGGKQYRVTPGEEVQLERLGGEPGDTVTFEQVLLASDGGTVRFGQPFLEGSKVIGKIVRQGKHGKVMVIKYKRRKGYRRKRGHRQHYTLVRIENIET